MKVTNLRSRTMIIGGRPVEPGKTVTMPDDRLNEIQHLLDEGLVRIEGVRVTEDVRPYTPNDRKAYLESLSMSELRKIGDPVGAKDTKKSELIDEILRKEG